MTEQEWLACEDPKPMLEWVGGQETRTTRRVVTKAGRARRRRLLLFAAACWVRSTQGLTIPGWDSELQMLVAVGKGEIGVEPALERLWMWPSEDVSWAAWRAEGARYHTPLDVTYGTDARAAASEGKSEVRWDRTQFIRQWDEEGKVQSGLLRHIMGNPFRRFAAPDHWPQDVVQLAAALDNGYDCSFALHDALLEAGHADLAEHFRQEKWHPKGCWVADTILGMQ